jgi:AbrB family looped-hinge helix DNA binding protein
MPELLETARLDRHGRIVIPAAFRRALDLHEGDEVTVRLEGGSVRILTRQEAVRRVQELVAEYTTGTPSLVDELIEERRAEAADE